MAKHNYVSMYGLVRPGMVANSSCALCPVAVIRSDRDDNGRQVMYQRKYSTPIVVTEDPTMIDEIAGWAENDIVLIKGFLATKEVDKTGTCPFCETVNKRSEAALNARSGGNRIYISPIFVKKIRSYPDQGQAYADVIACAEISNTVFLVGNLTCEPIQGTYEDGKIYTRYQLAINRKYCPKGMQELMERTDFPWVYSYGSKALDDYQALHTGSMVCIDGALQTRNYKETYKCKNCGNLFDVKGRTLEVLSYDTEYLANYTPIGGSEEEFPKDE